MIRRALLAAAPVVLLPLLASAQETRDAERDLVLAEARVVVASEEGEREIFVILRDAPEEDVLLLEVEEGVILAEVLDMGERRDMSVTVGRDTLIELGEAVSEERFGGTLQAEGSEAIPFAAEFVVRDASTIGTVTAGEVTGELEVQYAPTVSVPPGAAAVALATAAALAGVDGAVTAEVGGLQVGIAPATPPAATAP
jgi:hypothetical protein